MQQWFAIAGVVLISALGARATAQPREEVDEESTEDVDAPVAIAAPPSNNDDPDSEVAPQGEEEASAEAQKPDNTGQTRVSIEGDAVVQAGSDQDGAGALGLAVTVEIGERFYLAADVHTSEVTGPGVLGPASLRRFLLTPDLGRFGGRVSVRGAAIRHTIENATGATLDVAGNLRVGSTPLAVQHSYDPAMGQWVSCESDCVTGEVFAFSGDVSIGGAFRFAKLDPVVNHVNIELEAGISVNGYYLSGLSQMPTERDALSRSLMGTAETLTAVFFAELGLEVNSVGCGSSAAT